MNGIPEVFKTSSIKWVGYINDFNKSLETFINSNTNTKLIFTFSDNSEWSIPQLWKLFSAEIIDSKYVLNL